MHVSCSLPSFNEYYWANPEKIQTGGRVLMTKIFILKKTHEIFRFVTLPLEIPEKTTLGILQNCVVNPN